MTDQVQQQEMRLEEIVQRQDEFLSKMDRTEFSRGTLQNETDTSLGRIHEMISRYRSDMISLVNEQDHINKSLDELRKLVKDTTFVAENNDKRLADIDQRAKAQEKTTRDHYEHSLRQAEIIPAEIADASHNYSKLHADTEKHLLKNHQETKRQLDKMHNENMRRLLAFDGIESALQTLLVRTEPPEKKPFFVIRIFKSIGRFFSVVLPSAFRKLKYSKKKEGK